MALKAGTVANFNNSLANEMEQAFQSEWQTVIGEALPDGGERERKILFAAIAQGLLSYLESNINGSLEVDVSVTQTGGGITSSGDETAVRLVTE
jgi:hypothetical protein